MYVKFVKDFEQFLVDDFIELDDVLARQLCEDGIALATSPPVAVKKVVKEVVKEPVIKKAVKKSKK